MDNLVTIPINGAIWEAIEKQALTMGLSANELVRYKLGEIFGEPLFHQAPIRISRPRDLPPPSDPFGNMLKIVEAQLNGAIGSGMIKCLSCLNPLTLDQLKAGACSCGTKIGEKE